MFPGESSELDLIKTRHERLVPRRAHEQQCATYSHEMTPDLKEAVGRVVIRLVPLLYGGMFGSLIDDLPLALGLAVLVSMGMDLAMGDRSLLRSMFKPLIRGGCPVLASLAHGLAAVFGVLGIRVPSALRDMRCGVS